MLLHVGEEHGNMKQNNNCREEGGGWGDIKPNILLQRNNINLFLGYID